MRSLPDYVKAIKVVCAKYKVPVIDLFTESGITEHNVESYTSDGLHPNETGHYKTAEVMADRLKRVGYATAHSNRYHPF